MVCMINIYSNIIADIGSDVNAGTNVYELGK